MSGYDEERIGELLRALPAAPAGWIEAARELPRVRAELDDLVERARADAELRARILADAEAALAARGVEPRPALVDRLRRRVTG
jgi:hypothetical protein